jgi:signal transduction histidine kinase
MGSIMSEEESRLYGVIILATVILAGILGYFLYVIIRQKNRVQAWQEARIKAEIETLENERKRIAGDLHDDIGPMLSAIKLYVNHVEPPNEEEKKIIGKASNLMDEVIQRFRDIAYDLLPNTLIRKGLITAIKEFVGKISEAHDLKIDFIHDNNIPLSSPDELNLYRIVQEIIHNTIKHSQASQLVLTLHKQDNQVVFTATDNGKGFDYDSYAVKQAGGIGLLNIQSRVTLLKGKLSVKSEKFRGTSYTILIPLVSE